jgi:YD repeat-containing protein
MAHSTKLFLVLLLTFYSAFALQGGPKQPEYMGFVPSKTPDMVDMLSGDFTYPVPLGDVPGPYGGFPLSMAYSAGVTPAQEASWVGLGWMLNAGSIDRQLRGVPDDMLGSGVLSYLYSYSRAEIWSVSVGAGWGPYSIGVTQNSLGGSGIEGGLAFAKGTMGASIGLNSDGSASVGLDVIAKDGATVGASVSMGPDGFESGSLDVGVAGQTMKGSLGVTITPDDISGNAGFGAQSESGSVGMSLNTDGDVTITASKGPLSVSYTPGSGASVGVSGMNFSAYSTTDGDTKTTTNSRTVIIPLPGGFTVDLGYSETTMEFWNRQATEQSMLGYMYQGGAPIYAEEGNNSAPAPSASGGSAASTSIPFEYTDKGIVLETEGNPLQGLLKPAADEFSVFVEGFGGAFRAYSWYTHKINISVDQVNDAPVDMSYGLNVDNGGKSQSGLILKNADDQTLAICRNTSICQDALANRSNFINGLNRLVVHSSASRNNYERSRIVFLMRGSGSFISDDFSTSGVSDFASHVPNNFLKNSGLEQPLYGGTLIEPILQQNGNLLAGFSIKRQDGTEYRFERPLHIWMEANYNYNDSTGLPIFVDQKAAREKGFWEVTFRAIGKWAELLYVPGKFSDAVFGAIGGFFGGENKLANICSEPDAKEKSISWSWVMKTSPYATTWMLTEVRGADYFDPSVNQNADINQTIGYHVKLEYTDPKLYWWRFPFSAPATDLASMPNFKTPKSGPLPDDCPASPNQYTSSLGLKEQIYLKKIQTKTHVAEFELNDEETSERLDAKGWSYPVEKQDPLTKSSYLPAFVGVVANFEKTGTNYTLKGVYLKQSLTEDQINLMINSELIVDNINIEMPLFINNSVINYKSRVKGVVSSVRLTTPVEKRFGSIYVEFKADESQFTLDFNYENKPIYTRGLFKATAEELDIVSTGAFYQYGLKGDENPIVNYASIIDGASNKFVLTSRYLNKIKVFDKTWSENVSSLNRPLRIIDFNYDYSLQDNTLNSYDSKEASLAFVRNGAQGPTTINKDYLHGKLTLKTIQESKCSRDSRCDTIPSYQFSYNGEGLSPFVETSDMSIESITRRSVNAVDYWGFWNPNAWEDNHSVHQRNASYFASAWSLNQIKEPTGGVFRIKYDRDTYRGTEVAPDSAFAFFAYDTEGDVAVLKLPPLKWVVDCFEPAGGYYDFGGVAGVEQANIPYVKDGKYDYLYKIGLIDVVPSIAYASLSEADARTSLLNKINEVSINNVASKELLLNLSGSLKTKIRKGPFRAGKVTRRRSVASVGTAGIQSAHFINTSFNWDAAYNDGGEVGGNYEVPVNSGYLELKTNLNFKELEESIRRALYYTYDQERKGWSDLGGKIGMLTVRKDTILRGGNLRVTELERYDIGTKQSTRYDYELKDQNGKPTQWGSLAQYADSVFSGKSLGRFFDQMTTWTMVSANFTGISRVWGISDDERSFLPGPSITYPKIRQYNQSTNAKGQAINGYTDQYYITAESGIPSEYLPQIPGKLILSGIWTYQSNTGDGSAPNKELLIQFEVKKIDQPVTYQWYKIQNDKRTNIEVDGLEPKDLEYIKISKLVMATKTIKSTIGSSYDIDVVVNPVVKNLPINSYLYNKASSVTSQLQKFSKIPFSLFLPSENVPSIMSVASIQQQQNVPIVVSRTRYSTSKLVTDLTELGQFKTPIEVEYHDYGALLGRQIKSEIYRGVLGSSQLIKSDSMVYTIEPQSIDNRFATNAVSGNSFKQVETWSVSRRRTEESTKDKWSSFDDIPFDQTTNFNNAQKTKYKHIRYQAFLVKSIGRIGSGAVTADNKPDFAKMKWTRMDQALFDPILGSPNLTVAYADGRDTTLGARLTLNTPAHYINGSIGTKLLIANRLQSPFRTDEFLWRGQNLFGLHVNSLTPSLLYTSYLDRLVGVVIHTYGNIVWQSALDAIQLCGSTRQCSGVPLITTGKYSFAPQRDLQNYQSVIGPDQNQSLISGAKTDVSLPVGDRKLWNGSWVTHMTPSRQPIAEVDIYGRTAVMNYGIDRTQTGYFRNVQPTEVATLVATGYWNPTAFKPAPSNSYQAAQNGWVFSGTWDHSVQQSSDGFLWIKPGTSISKSFDFSRLSTGDTIIVEGQGFKGGSSSLLVSIGGLNRSLNLDPNQGEFELKIAVKDLSNRSVNMIVSGPDIRLRYLRIYPKGANPGTYLYDERGNMVQSVDENNISTYFNYNAKGDLVSIKNHDGVFLTDHFKHLMNP